MQYFNGFSLIGEEYLFKEYINTSEYCVCGFSYGSIKALNEVKKRLLNSQRVDTLQLFSPAFFQTKDAKFKRLQILSYNKNELLYLKKFMASCFYPHEQKIVQQIKTNTDELDELLEYIWNLDDLKKVIDAGVKLEVYLGQKDMVID
ncbi:MAG: pimelyl-ACP methyl ester esterase BioV, partial [Epsilonproteobacteria bacterium]|nr:pimelyl-ACP methyl ester esterase BioV [Campylobacterota bacterium]